MALSDPSTTRRRWIAAAAASAVVLGACSEQEDATPGTAPVVIETTTTTTTTTLPPATTTTSLAPETTTTTTTTGPTTTAAPVPTGDPTDLSTPVFAGSSSDAWVYLGRWTGSGWEPAFDEGGASNFSGLTEGTEVTIAELGQTPVSGSAGAAGEACVIEPDTAIEGPVITPNAGVPDVPGFGYRAIALPAEWNVHPREAVGIDETIQAYADAGVATFADDAVETQAGEVDQTVLSDLDGDGDTEVLVVFGHENERVEGQTEPPGGFSALLLLNADSRAATEVAKSFTPPAVEGEPVQPFDSYRVLDVADLNGDGIAEVVVHTWFTGGAEVTVYTYDGAGLTEVLTAGCSV